MEEIQEYNNKNELVCTKKPSEVRNFKKLSFEIVDTNTNLEEITSEEKIPSSCKRVVVTNDLENFFLEYRKVKDFGEKYYNVLKRTNIKNIKTMKNISFQVIKEEIASEDKNIPIEMDNKEENSSPEEVSGEKIELENKEEISPSEQVQGEKIELNNKEEFSSPEQLPGEELDNIQKGKDSSS